MNHKLLIETVIIGVCGSKTCQADKAAKALCQKKGKCSIAEKSEDQLRYVVWPNTKNVFLKACPGSGKTEVVALKAAFEFRNWNKKNRGVAILAFTNNATDVISERVHEYAGVEKTAYPHFVGTFDSWLHRYIAHPYGHLTTGYKGRADDRKHDKSLRLVDDRVSAGWINNYKCETGYCYFPRKNASPCSVPLYANMLYYDEENQRWQMRPPASGHYLVDENYYASPAFASFRQEKPWLTLERMRESFRSAKDKFLRDGFATYQDIESICYRLLRDSEWLAQKLSLRFPFVIVDECQDLSWVQLEILGFLKQSGTALHFIGDLDQAIYEFKKVDPDKVNAFVRGHGFEQQNLVENFRSCQAIVDLCQKLVHCASVTGKATSPDEPACVCFFYKGRHEISLLLSAFERYLKARGYDAAKSAVLARGRSMVHQLRALERKQTTKPEELAMAIHLWRKNDARLRSDALKFMGDFITGKYFQKAHLNSRQYFCPDSVSSPVRWRLFLARMLDMCTGSNSGVEELGQPWKTWSACVREDLSAIINSCVFVLQGVANSGLPAFDKLDGNTFRAPAGSANLPVIGTLATRQGNLSYIRTTTIHSVKGETFDAVMLVSAPDQSGSQGGHWLEWLRDTHSEHARFAYVGSSRPKNLLAWSIPLSDKTPENSRKLIDLGFSFAEFPQDDNQKDAEANDR